MLIFKWENGMSVQIISLIGVPVDVVPPEDLEMTVLELLARPGTKQIVFLSVWDFFVRAIRGNFKTACAMQI